MKYIIVQTRTDATGKINKVLLKELTEFKVFRIHWIFKSMMINHLIELIQSIWLGLKLKKNDIVFSTNSKSIHTHIIPLFSKCKKYMIHYHFDEKPLILHKLPFWNYKWLLSEWYTIFAAKTIQKIAKDKFNCKNSSVNYPGLIWEEKEWISYMLEV